MSAELKSGKPAQFAGNSALALNKAAKCSATFALPVSGDATSAIAQRSLIRQIRSSVERINTNSYISRRPL